MMLKTTMIIITILSSIYSYICIMILFTCIGIGISINQLNTLYYTGPVLNEWIMVGAITSFSATFRIGLNNNYNADQNQLFIVSTDPNYTNIIYQQSIYDLIMNNTNDNNASVDNEDVVISQLIRIVNMTDNENNNNIVIAFELYQLQSLTQYYYKINNNNNNDGTFYTPALIGTRFNFSIITAGCAHTASNHPIFEHMSNEYHTEDEVPILMMIHLGDFHYEDIYNDNIIQRMNAISSVLSSPKQRLLYQSTSISYMWDDHDWLGNNSGNRTNEKNTNISSSAYNIALQSYQIVYPHYPLAAGLSLSSATTDTTSSAALDSSVSTSDTTTTTTTSNQQIITALYPISLISPYHAYTIGTVRFIITDLRSESSNTSIYSIQQKLWFYNELYNSYQYDYIIWISTKPWIGKSKNNDDSWFGHTIDRSELSYFISHNMTKQNLLVLSADAHMIAYDDGTNTYYGGNNDNDDNTDNDTIISSFPILQSGSMDRIGSAKGGPFTHNCYTYTNERTNQYSKLSFIFPSSNNDSVQEQEPCIYIESYRINSLHEKVLLLQIPICGTNIFKTIYNNNAENTNMNNNNTSDESTTTSYECTGQSFETSSSNMLYTSIAITILSFILLLYMYCCNIHLIIQKQNDDDDDEGEVVFHHHSQRIKNNSDNDDIDDDQNDNSNNDDRTRQANNNSNNNNSMNNRNENNSNDDDDKDNDNHINDDTKPTVELNNENNDDITHTSYQNCYSNGKRNCHWFYIAWIVLFGYVLMIVIAMSIPFAKNIPVFTLRPYSILALVQSIFIFIWIILLYILIITSNKKQQQQ